MRTVEALKNLYTALGGTLSDIETITNISDVVNAISAIAGGGSGGLTVKTATFHTEVPEANAGLISIKNSDFPADYVGGFKPLRIYMDYNVVTDINWTNPVYFTDGGGHYYMRGSDNPGFVYDSSKNIAVGVKVAILYEYLAKEE